MNAGGCPQYRHGIRGKVFPVYLLGILFLMTDSFSLRAASRLRSDPAEAARSAEVRIPREKPLSHDIQPGPGVKSVMLSACLPSLADTPGDTPVYILEGEKPGGTAFVAGGTHPGEIAGSMAALLLIEHARVVRGRLIVIPYANNSAASWPDPRRPNSPKSFTVETPSGSRTFVIGSRLTKPEHQGEPDPPAAEAPGPEYVGDNVARNLDRQFPGEPEGNLTERIAYAVVELIKREAADLAFDLHEAPPGSRLALMVVANPKNIELGAEAMLDLEAQGLTMKLEESSETFRGLSHREWGDATQARSFLFETPSPLLHRTTPGDPVDDAEWPLPKRVGIHLLTMKAIIGAHNAGVEASRRIEIEGIPGLDDLMKSGLGAFLK
jgi:hypothetical protein